MLNKIFGAWKFLSDTLIYIIFPPFCPICQEIVDERGDICSACLEKIMRQDFFSTPPAQIEKVLRLTKYRDGTRGLLRKLKFENNLKVLPTLKKILEIASTDSKVTEFLKGVDVAVFVPLHEERLNRRGYNQTELIFSDWLTAQGVRAENFLKRTKKTPRLFNLTPAERRETLKDAFEVVEGADVAGKKILIVDDIYTTGATVTECAKSLKKMHAAQIYVLALASDFGSNRIA